MSIAMKEYNLLTLDYDKDEPSFTNDDWNFWLIDEHERFPLFVARNIKTKERHSLIGDRKTGKFIKGSKHIETLSEFRTMFENGMLYE